MACSQTSFRSNNSIAPNPCQETFRCFTAGTGIDPTLLAQGIIQATGIAPVVGNLLPNTDQPYVTIGTGSGRLIGGDAVINIAPMVGATTTTAGVAGVVPAPTAGTLTRALFVDGTYKEVLTGAVGDLLGSTSAVVNNGTARLLGGNATVTVPLRIGTGAGTAVTLPTTNGGYQLQSAGNTVTITNPAAGVINIEAAPGTATANADLLAAPGITLDGGTSVANVLFGTEDITVAKRGYNTDVMDIDTAGTSDVGINGDNLIDVNPTGPYTAARTRNLPNTGAQVGDKVTFRTMDMSPADIASFPYQVSATSGPLQTAPLSLAPGTFYEFAFDGANWLLTKTGFNGFTRTIAGTLPQVSYDLTGAGNRPNFTQSGVVHKTFGEGIQAFATTISVPFLAPVGYKWELDYQVHGAVLTNQFPTPTNVTIEVGLTPHVNGSANTIAGSDATQTGYIPAGTATEGPNLNAMGIFPLPNSLAPVTVAHELKVRVPTTFNVSPAPLVVGEKYFVAILHCIPV